VPVPAALLLAHLVCLLLRDSSCIALFHYLTSVQLWVETKLAVVEGLPKLHFGRRGARLRLRVARHFRRLTIPDEARSLQRALLVAVASLYTCQVLRLVRGRHLLPQHAAAGHGHLLGGFARLEVSGHRAVHPATRHLARVGSRGGVGKIVEQCAPLIFMPDFALDESSVRLMHGSQGGAEPLAGMRSHLKLLREDSFGFVFIGYVNLLVDAHARAGGRDAQLGRVERGVACEGVRRCVYVAS